MNPHFYLPAFKLFLDKIREIPNRSLAEIVSQSAVLWDQSPQSFGDEFPYIEISAVRLGVDEYDIRMLATRHAPSRARMIVKANDIIISTTRPHRGAVAMIKQEDDGCIASTGFAVLRIRHDVRDVLREYLLNIIASPMILQQFLQRSSGGNYPAITSDEIGKVLVPIPSIELQEKLVAKMQVAQESRKKKLAQADELLAGMDEFIFKQLGIRIQTLEGKDIFAIRLKDCFNNQIDAKYHSPKYYQLASALSNCPHPKIPLGVISPEIAGGATPKRGDTALYATEGIKFLRILNICPNEITLKDVKYIHNSVHDGILSRSKLSIDDILMTITGRVGTAAVVTTNILPANINQHIVRLRIIKDNCLPEYLAAWLNTSIGIELSNRGVTGGTRIALDYEAIRNLEIPIPPLPVQQTIIEELLHRRTEVQHLQKEGERDWQRAKADFEAQLFGNGTAL